MKAVQMILLAAVWLLMLFIIAAFAIVNWHFAMPVLVFFIGASLIGSAAALFKKRCKRP